MSRRLGEPELAGASAAEHDNEPLAAPTRVFSSAREPNVVVADAPRGAARSRGAAEHD